MGQTRELPGGELRVLPDQAAVAAEAARLVLAAAADAIAARGAYRLCLAGGTTPAAAYRLLAEADTQWSAWHLYHGDERCLPADDPERNNRAADAAWLDHVPVPRSQVCAIPAEQGAEAAAAAYEPLIEAALPFDLVLLGMGEDGHTASLFPGRPLPDHGSVVPVHQAPKPPPDRVSLTPQALAESRRMLILVTGRGKAAALRDWRAGAPLPVARVAAQGRALVLADRDAAAEV